MEKNGTSYGNGTPDAVIALLESARASGARLRLFYGDQKTGKSWHEENDVIGTVSRSGGQIKIPLLIPNARSTGGGGILTGSIVAIATAPGRFAYRHPTLDLGTFEILPSDLPEYAERVLVDGVNHARFKRVGAAARWVQFMKGERFAK